VNNIRPPYRCYRAIKNVRGELKHERSERATPAAGERSAEHVSDEPAGESNNRKGDHDPGKCIPACLDAAPFLHDIVILFHVGVRLEAERRPGALRDFSMAPGTRTVFPS